MAVMVTKLIVVPNCTNYSAQPNHGNSGDHDNQSKHAVPVQIRSSNLEQETFEIDRKLEILVTDMLYTMIEGGVIKAFIVAPCFIKR
jgi:hypothetical protein